MRIPFRLVDVFADQPLAGNQLCVLPNAPSLAEGTMQAIAREIGFSETTFVTSTSRDRYAMRIFTPTGELPFAGHPTLGTAYVLVSEGIVTSPAVQEVTAGEFPVEVDIREGTARVRQLPPQFGEEIRDLRTVAEAAGVSLRDLDRNLRPQVVSTGLPFLIVPAASISAVVHAEPDYRALAHLVSAVGADGCYVFCLTPEGAKARMFDPDPGIFEDAATGSAAGPLGAYLAAHGVLDGELFIRQGEEIGRPSRLHVTTIRDGGTWNIVVGGAVFVVGDGFFDLE